MYAAAHTSLALAAKRRVPAASLLGLMITAQASELLWVGLSYAGVEHSRVDGSGTMHLDHLPISHSVLSGVVGGLAVWAVVRFALKRPDVATVFGLVFLSHTVLDIVQHEPDIRILPWLASPTVGLNLAASPFLDFLVETALCIACWAYYRGTWKLLAALVLLNLLNLPLMIAGQGDAAPMAANPFLLPTVILVTIVLAWAVVGAFGRRARADRPASSTPPPSRTPEVAAG